MKAATVAAEKRLVFQLVNAWTGKIGGVKLTKIIIPFASSFQELVLLSPCFFTSSM
jgi:hypothetical protein